MTIEVGVIGLQGDVPEHTRAISAALDGRVRVRAVRATGILPECDVIAIPGGESTTISRLLASTGIDEEVRAHAAAGRPVLATCAGLIVCARSVEDPRIDPLGLLDVTVTRNAFGRQRDSFEAPLAVRGLDDPFPGIFIRAPRIASVGNVEVLARVGEEPVAVRDGSVVGASFHPELTEDPRFHRLAIGEAR